MKSGEKTTHISYAGEWDQELEHIILFSFNLESLT